MQPINSRVDDDLIEWLNAQRGPGETRSHVLRRFLEAARQAPRDAQIEILNWRFHSQ